MSHKFRFSKDCMERLKSYANGETPPAPVPAPEAGEGDGADHKGKKAKQSPAMKEPAPARETPAAAEEAAKEASAGLWVTARTDIGKVRRSNQDAIIADEDECLYGVADGMGGHNGGETASAGARDGLIELLRGKDPDLANLRTGIMAVNRRLFLQQKEDESLSGMGTTLTALWLSDHFVYVGHVGDSRAYRLRNGELTQITDDHSVVAELVRAGMLTPEQAENHPMRNVITRAVGTEEGIEIDLMAEERQSGDVWLVCSDGLYGMVGKKAMEAILSTNTLEKAADLLIEAALAAGGRDNVSLVLLRDGEVKA